MPDAPEAHRREPRLQLPVLLPPGLRFLRPAVVLGHLGGGREAGRLRLEREGEARPAERRRAVDRLLGHLTGATPW